MKIELRPITKYDNIAIASVIRSILKEHGVNKPGTVFTDPTTDNLFELFEMENSNYWVALVDNEIVGGCGIYPTIGLPDGCIELVKLYVLKKARGLGLGKKLMLESAKLATELGYKEIYLETMPELSNAIGLYEELGYKRLNAPLGDSGHFACDIWMLNQL